MEREGKVSARGGTSMDPERRRAIDRKGGQSVSAEKQSFSQNAALAAAAGRKGGISVYPAIVHLEGPSAFYQGWIEERSYRARRQKTKSFGLECPR